jgi:hypothetical protein
VLNTDIQHKIVENLQIQILPKWHFSRVIKRLDINEKNPNLIFDAVESSMDILQQIKLEIDSAILIVSPIFGFSLKNILI